IKVSPSSPYPSPNKLQPTLQPCPTITPSPPPSLPPRSSLLRSPSPPSRSTPPSTTPSPPSSTTRLTTTDTTKRFSPSGSIDKHQNRPVNCSTNIFL
ncbi:hypothetical protein PRIPAC_80436, partial [Pristionchus pacificus]